MQTTLSSKTQYSFAQDQSISDLLQSKFPLESHHSSFWLSASLTKMSLLFLLIMFSLQLLLVKQETQKSEIVHCFWA